MSTTPKGERLHISIYGKRNAGKSTLLNALVGQSISIVSDVAGTTTDPVSKAIELGSLGPCLITDTAGFDDAGRLGGERVASTERTLEQADVALLLVSDWGLDARYGEDLLRGERAWIERLRERKIPFLTLLGKADLRGDAPADAERLAKALSLGEGERVQPFSALAEDARGFLIECLQSTFRDRQEDLSITRGLVSAGDTVLLVMPQDASAPKGRLILPQVQTIRELLDKGAIALCCTPSTLCQTLDALTTPPRLIITDSQAFAEVARQRPEASLLTSFSVLFAGYKGDIDLFVEGARAIEALTPSSRVLIAEACTHAPASEDIGRVKIPALLRRRYGESIEFDVFSGADYPEDLTGYDLIVHCGACMFGRVHVLRRLERARAQGVPITNYGICMAYLTGILDQIVY